MYSNAYVISIIIVSAHCAIRVHTIKMTAKSAENAMKRNMYQVLKGKKFPQIQGTTVGELLVSSAYQVITIAQVLIVVNE